MEKVKRMFTKVRAALKDFIDPVWNSAAVKEIRRYLWANGVAVDIWLNALTGGKKYETISMRAAKAMNKGKRWGCVLCKLLDKIDKNHCEDSLTDPRDVDHNFARQ